MAEVISDYNHLQIGKLAKRKINGMLKYILTKIKSVKITYCCNFQILSRRELQKQKKAINSLRSGVKKLS